MSHATFTGLVKSVATATNPLQTVIDFILTDFKPNNNGEALCLEDADSIIASVLSMPLKANFSNGKINGHAYALPVGTITHAELVNDDNPHIMARAMIWRDEYKELDTYLRKRAEQHDPIGTSWELYYKSIDEKDGIKWLKEPIMAASTIVQNPAYGNRTPVLALAEMMNMEDSNIEKLNKLESTIWAIWDMICELREDAATADAIAGIDSLPETLRMIVDNVKTQLGKMNTAEAELKEQLATAELKVTELSDKIAGIEKAQAEDALYATRVSVLESKNIAVTEDRRAFILSLSEDQFTQYVSDLSSVIVKSTAETKVVNKIPNLIGSVTPTLDVIAAALNAKG